MPVCYLLVDADFEELVILERLGAENQPVIVLGEIPHRRAVVVR